LNPIMTVCLVAKFNHAIITKGMTIAINWVSLLAKVEHISYAMLYCRQAAITIKLHRQNAHKTTNLANFKTISK